MVTAEAAPRRRCAFSQDAGRLCTNELRGNPVRLSVLKLSQSLKVVDTRHFGCYIGCKTPFSSNLIDVRSE